MRSARIFYTFFQNYQLFGLYFINEPLIADANCLLTVLGITLLKVAGVLLPLLNLLLYSTQG